MIPKPEKTDFLAVENVLSYCHYQKGLWFNLNTVNIEDLYKLGFSYLTVVNPDAKQKLSATRLIINKEGNESHLRIKMYIASWGDYFNQNPLILKDYYLFLYLCDEKMLYICFKLDLRLEEISLLIEKAKEMSFNDFIKLLLVKYEPTFNVLSADGDKRNLVELPCFIISRILHLYHE